MLKLFFLDTFVQGNVFFSLCYSFDTMDKLVIQITRGSSWAILHFNELIYLVNDLLVLLGTCYKVTFSPSGFNGMASAGERKRQFHCLKVVLDFMLGRNEYDGICLIEYEFSPLGINIY